MAPWSSPPASPSRRAAVFATAVLGVGLLAASPPRELPASDPVRADIEVRRPEDLGPLLEPIRRKHRLPALAGAILAGDRIVAEGAVGHRKRGSRQPVTTGDRWHLASCGKAMTATVVARLVERGVLRWDTTLAEGLPELADVMHADYRDVTLELLLAHRGGVPGDLVSLPVWSWLWEADGSAVEERAHFVRELVEQPPANPPGTTYLYSNGGYTLVGAVAERAAGVPWEELVRVELYEPLGMRSIGGGAPKGSSRLAEPWGHPGDAGGGAPGVPPGPKADNPPAVAPAGTLHASLADWARFARLHLAGARGRTAFLAPETFTRLHTAPPGQEYALGWIATRRPWAGDGLVLTHSGSNGMWYATVWIAPGRDFAVLVVTNQGGDRGASAADDAAAALIGRALAP